MSTPVNYYIGIPRGKFNLAAVIAAAVSQTTAVDVEIRMQIDNGTTTTKLTKEDVVIAMRTLEQYLLSNGLPGGTPGTDLPVG